MKRYFAGLVLPLMFSLSAFASNVTCTLEENFVKNPVTVGPITSANAFTLNYKGQSFMVDQSPQGKIRLMIPIDAENMSIITTTKDLNYGTVINGISVSIMCEAK